MGGMMISVGPGRLDGSGWFTEAVDVIDEMLASIGLPPHRDPGEVPDDAQWPGADEIPHSFFDRLRRVQAWVNQGRGLPPALPEGTDAASDPMIDEEIPMLDSHLVLHVSEGFYVPVVFDEPMLDERLPGRALGSSQRLMQELKLTGEAFGIPVDGEPLPEAVVAQIQDEADRDDVHGPEKLMWFALYDAARRSIRHRALIHHGG